MADERLDDLTRRIRELEARVAGLSEEQATLSDSVAAIEGSDSSESGPETATERDGAEPAASDRDLADGSNGAASWTDPASREYDGSYVEEGAGASGSEKRRPTAVENAESDPDEERDIVMAPPKGASQAAVQAAVDEVERSREHEENVVL